MSRARDSLAGAAGRAYIVLALAASKFGTTRMSCCETEAETEDEGECLHKDCFEVVRECFVGRAAGEGERSVLRRLKNRFREEERRCFDEEPEEEVGRETMCMGEMEFIKDCFSSSVNGDGVC